MKTRLITQLEESSRENDYYHSLKLLTTIDYVQSLLSPSDTSLQQRLDTVKHSIRLQKPVESHFHEFPSPSFPTPPVTPIAPILAPVVVDAVVEEPLRNRKRVAVALETDSDAVMQQHHDLQSSLTDSLAQMASQLKSNTVQFSQSLAIDKTVMETAQDKLGGNLMTMQKEGGRLEGYKRTAGGTTCFVLMAVGAVAAAWVTTFLLIKVT